MQVSQAEIERRYYKLVDLLSDEAVADQHHDNTWIEVRRAQLLIYGELLGQDSMADVETWAVHKRHDRGYRGEKLCK